MRAITALALTIVITALAVGHSAHYAIAAAGAVAFLCAARIALVPVTLDHMIEETATMTAADAQRYLGIPASSVRAWASAGPGREPRLYARAMTRTRAKLYAVSDLLTLRESTQRRATHTRPSRAACPTPEADIAFTP